MTDVSPTRPQNAALVLEDGTTFLGYAFGARTQVVGEVVFNTSMTGYPELLSDPSYKDQLVTLTTSEVGNYGVCRRDLESDGVQVSALLVKSLSPVASNWRSDDELDAFLQSENVPGMWGFDTRALVRHIRDKGAMRGALAAADDGIDADKLLALRQAACDAPSMKGRSLVEAVGTQTAYTFEEGLIDDAGQSVAPLRKPAFKVVAIDCGMKKNIGRLLVHHGCEVRVLPPTATIDDIRAESPQGLFLSNGPGDPSTETHLVSVVKELVGTLPIFGICLGHQLLSQALGADTYKTTFGHRGGNQPVLTPEGVVLITSQNHGFAVDDKGLKADGRPVYANVSDGTNEGVVADDKHAFSVQHHPEAAPGPRDAAVHFEEFMQLMARFHDVSLDDVAGQR